MARTKIQIRAVCDNQRHLISIPYSIKNLHLLATKFGIGRHWFHKDHYDIPKQRIDEIKAKSIVVRPRTILLIIKHTKQ